MYRALARRSFPAQSRNIATPVSPGHLAKLFEVSDSNHWGRHQLLLRAGDPASSLQRITSGVVAVSIAMSDARRQIIVFLFKDDICGLVQSDGRYAFDYEAITEVTTQAIDMNHVQRLVTSLPDVAKALQGKMARSHARVTEQLVAVGQLNGQERVVYFLRRLSQSYAERGIPTDPLLLPMTRLDIADHLGIRLETLSRLLTKLKRQQLIDLPDANTIVLNVGAIALECGGLH